MPCTCHYSILEDLDNGREGSGKPDVKDKGTKDHSSLGERSSGLGSLVNTVLGEGRQKAGQGETVRHGATVLSYKPHL